MLRLSDVLHRKYSVAPASTAVRLVAVTGRNIRSVFSRRATREVSSHHSHRLVFAPFSSVRLHTIPMVMMREQTYCHGVQRAADTAVQRPAARSEAVRQRHLKLMNSCAIVEAHRRGVSVIPINGNTASNYRYIGNSPLHMV